MGDKGNPGRVARGRGEEAGEGTAGSDPGCLERGPCEGHRGVFAQGSPPSRCWRGGISRPSGVSVALGFWFLRQHLGLQIGGEKNLTSTAVKAAAGFGAGAEGAVTDDCGPALPSGLDCRRRGPTDRRTETGDGAAASLPGGGKGPTDLSHPSRRWGPWDRMWLFLGVGAIYQLSHKGSLVEIRPQYSLEGD